MLAGSVEGSIRLELLCQGGRASALYCGGSAKWETNGARESFFLAVGSSVGAGMHDSDRPQ